MVTARYDDHAIVPPSPAFAGGHIPTALDEYLFGWTPTSPDADHAELDAVAV